MPALVDVMSMEYNCPGSLHSRITCDSVTCEHFGPTACVRATVKLTVRDLSPSSFSTQSRCTMSVVFRLLWKSTKNFDLENSNDINVSTLIGSMVCTSCRPSCIELHSAVLMNGMFWPFSESLESDISVGTRCSEIGGMMLREDLLRILRCVTLGSYFCGLSLMARSSGADDATLSECGSEWSWRVEMVAGFRKWFFVLFVSSWGSFNNCQSREESKCSLKRLFELHYRTNPKQIFNFKWQTSDTLSVCLWPACAIVSSSRFSYGSM